jgi:hypothetical protein
VIDLRKEEVLGLMSFGSESVSNEMDESDSHFEKHDEERN